LSIEVSNLSFSYGTRSVLNQISFKAEDSSLLSILGPNGVGKSTLFRCMLGLLGQYEGRASIDGKDIRGLSVRQLARLVAYIPQSHYPAFNYSVFDMVLMGTTAQVNGVSSPGKRQIALADAALERMQISHLRNRAFLQIRGGEQQLALIARALAQETKVLVMDEPTANLDYGNQLRVMKQVKSLASEGYTVVQATHSPDQAFLYSDDILALLEGRVIAFGPPREVLTTELIRELYGVAHFLTSPLQATRVFVPFYIFYEI
jgi:iron complex transport system ATP-binding protein